MNTRTRLAAAAGVLLLFGLIWLYTREFRVFGNTIGLRGLLLGAFAAGLLVAAAVLYTLRKRLTPWGNHLPEFFIIVFFCALPAPLFVSLLNRAVSRKAFESFEFVSERPYFSSAYGLMKGEKIKVSGYTLQVLDGTRLLRFRYKTQAYFPLTQPGETVLLPVRKGCLGFQVVELW